MRRTFALYGMLGTLLCGSAVAAGPAGLEERRLPDLRGDLSLPELLISSEDLRPGLHVTSADAAGGIRGYVASETGALAVRFESRVTGGVLWARITGKEELPLVELIENGRSRPELIVLGTPYRMYGERSFDRALRSLSATAGPLIRTLGYGIAGAAPGEDLRRERRGLQVPFQAIQQYVGVLPGVYVNDSDLFADSQRFTVKGLDPRLILKENWVQHSRSVHSSSLEGVFEAHDEGRVGSCFGRCGGGCGTWYDGPVYCNSSSWTVTYNDGYQECGWLDCTGPCGHTACGCRAHGCASHDWCVRNICNGDAWCAECWDEAIWAGITYTSCFFMNSTCWSYVEGTCSTSQYHCNNLVP